MPTSPPTNPNPKSYVQPRPPEQSVDRGGYDAPATPDSPTYNVGRGQERRPIDAASMPDQATGNAGQRASGRIEEGVPSVTQPDGAKVSG